MEGETLDIDTLIDNLIDQPVYVSIAGIFDDSSASETENEDPIETKRVKRDVCTTKKSSYYEDPDYREEEDATSLNIGQLIDDNQMVSNWSKKQMNKLAAMDIFPIPSGCGIPGNASLFNPVTIQWLLENYETKTGVSLPRSTVYNHYIRHCRLHDMEPVNAASFGKLIRSIFLGLQTRRLGTRGNSKYHYYGIQIKPESLLNDVEDSGSNSDSEEEGGRKSISIESPVNNTVIVVPSSSLPVSEQETQIIVDQNQDQDGVKLNMLADAVRPHFEDSARFMSYARLKELDFAAALSMNITPISKKDKFFSLMESYRQTLCTILDFDGYSNWMKTEVDKNFTEIQAYIKDLSYVLHVICSQVAFVDPDANAFFSLLQLFTDSYILYLLQNRKDKMSTTELCDSQES